MLINNQTIKQSNNQTIKQSNNQTIKQSNNQTIITIKQSKTPIQPFFTFGPDFGNTKLAEKLTAFPSFK
jgi:hypothetical protein